MKDHGINPDLGNAIYSAHVPDFASLVEIRVPTQRLILFIAADAREVSSEAIARVAEHFLRGLLVYVCTWGPDCERVHDVFDEVWIGNGETERAVFLMSTWHSRDPLEEALWYFLACTDPSDGEVENTVGLAVTVGCTDWIHIVEQALSDLPRFISERVGEADDE